MNKTSEYSLVISDPTNEELLWSVQVGDTAVGTVGIDTNDTQYVESPSVHMTIDEANQAIVIPAMKEIIKYAYCHLPSEVLYSRQQVGDTAMDKRHKSLGFEKDSETYTDDDGLTWQNIKLVL